MSRRNQKDEGVLIFYHESMRNGLKTRKNHFWNNFWAIFSSFFQAEKKLFVGTQEAGREDCVFFIHHFSFIITQSVDEINFVCGRNNFRPRTKKISTADEIWPRHSLVTMRFANSHQARARHCTRQGVKIIYTFFPSERNYQKLFRNYSTFARFFLTQKSQKYAEMNK